MMRRLMHIVPALLLAFGLSAPVGAQTQTGIVEGKVFDQQNAVLRVQPSRQPVRAGR